MKKTSKSSNDCSRGAVEWKNFSVQKSIKKNNSLQNSTVLRWVRKNCY